MEDASSLEIPARSLAMEPAFQEWTPAQMDMSALMESVELPNGTPIGHTVSWIAPLAPVLAVAAQRNRGM